jgi:FAD/FMN-containing dehydrogenase
MPEIAKTCAGLDAVFAGNLLRPGDDGYEAARRVYNETVDKRPGLIAYASGVADVVAAVNAAREEGVSLAVRGRGYSTPGTSVCDDGIVIDLSRLTGVHVDPGTATVRAGAGVDVAALDRETQVFGLAVPSGVLNCGIAGLALGGGLGWVRRKFGLTSDSLLSAQVVTAAGEVITASKDENADLFWALRGGGGNFGVVTSFEFQAYEVGPDVHMTVVNYRVDDASAALRYYDAWCDSAPEEVTSFAILATVPEGDFFGMPPEQAGDLDVMFGAVGIGPVEAAEQATLPLRQWAPQPVDIGGRMPYQNAQQFFSAEYEAEGLRHYWCSVFLDELTEEAIGTLAGYHPRRPSEYTTLSLWHLEGAVARGDEAISAFGRRDAKYMLCIEGNWEGAEADAENIAFCRELHQAMSRLPKVSGEHPLYPGLLERGAAATREAFGEARFQRLLEVKKKYDPASIFSLSQQPLADA